MMTKQEALERFRVEVEPILEQSKVQFYEVLEEKVEDFVEILQDVLEKLKVRIEELEKEKIMFFHFSLMRIGILQQTYEALVQAMDARWYLDTEIASVPFSLDVLFTFFNDIRQQLTEKSRKYQGKVNFYDIEHCIEETIMACNSLLVQQLRFMFRDIEENPTFSAIEKTQVWGIYWGEYRDACEIVVQVNREKKTSLDWERALRQTKNEETNLVSSFWYQMQLKDSDCKGKFLYFIQFEHCELENFCFDEAMLSGAQFKHCTIKNCSFRNAEVRQAIFLDCHWGNNDFTGANLENSVISEDSLPFIHLEPEQLQTIFVDRG